MLKFVTLILTNIIIENRINTKIIGSERNNVILREKFSLGYNIAFGNLKIDWPCNYSKSCTFPCGIRDYLLIKHQ